MEVQVNVLPILFLLILINLGSFCMMWNDKRKARKKGTNRTPERRLFAVAWFLGSIGIWLGMRVFRHKTQKKKFTFGIPAVFLVQVVALALVDQQIDIHYFFNWTF